jgi:6-phosphofructokinase
MGKVKTVGVVNRGGDAPGLNAVIRAVVRPAIGAHGMRAIGTTFGDCA